VWALTNWGVTNRAMIFLNIDKRGRSTLPEEVRRDLGIEGNEGALVILEKTPRGTYELVPAALVPRDQLWFHHSKMRERLEEAEADFRAGRSTRAETPEEAQRYLDSLKG
jgi:bifunctional DNA-binding transcriptional regulator/antitoxin component of YhaV-PrlF toxin-antitoxin module